MAEHDLSIHYRTTLVHVTMLMEMKLNPALTFAGIIYSYLYLDFDMTWRI